MVENQAFENNNPQQAIILDLSLFILDFLDSKKIQEIAEVRNHILEVPSALALMLRDSRVGDPTLFLFIYSLLVKAIINYREKHEIKPIKDQKILRLISSPDFAVRGNAWRITQQLYDQFSSLIDISPTIPLPEDLTSQGYGDNSNNSNYPIRRYDSIGSFSQEDQKRLRAIYTAELNLPEHPLYDLYFSQIFHAQTVGGMGEARTLRRAVSLEDETFKIVSDWKGKTRLDPKSDIVKVSRDFIEWFTKEYIKREWRGLVFDGTLEVAVAGILTGTVIGSLGVSLVTLGGGTLLKSIIETPKIPDPLKPFYFGATLLVMICCLILIVRPKWFIPSNASQSTSSNSPPLLPTPVAMLPNSIPTATVISTVAVIPPVQTLTPLAFFPVNASDVNNSPNYCLYVVQSGDTIQSIASWFTISENDIRDSDNRVSRGVFKLHQLIRVPAFCCTRIGVNNGFSYSVQPKDNVFRLAINFSTSVDKIVTANNLSDSRYIQTGQMLCIPNP